MKKKYLLLLLCLPLLVTGCKKVPVLQDGKQVVVELEGKQITAEEFFDELKKTNGTGVLVNLANNYIVSKELNEELEKQAIEKAKAEFESYKVYYKDQWNEVLMQSGYTNEKDFLKDIENNFKQNLVLEKFIKSDVITEKEIKEYYDKDIYGEANVRHILIKADVNDNMKDNEKAEAKRKALEEATNLINQLKESKDLEKDFTNLAKEKSDDTGTASTGGLLENITNESGLVEEFWNATLNLQPGQMTQEPIETQFGYHIIYKVSQKEKPELDKVKEKIKDTLAKKKLNEKNANLIYWSDLRDKYKMVIHDDTIKNAYDSTIKAYK